MKKFLWILAVLLMAQPVLASEEIGRQEDTASASGHVLMPIGCARQDTTITDSTDANGDYALCKMMNGRIGVTSTIDSALPTGSNTIGNVGLAAGSNAIGSVTIGSGANAIGSVTVTSIIPGTGATNLAKREDDPHVSLDTGIPVWAVRHDVSSTGIGADGDYAALGVNSSGELYTSSNTELPAASQITADGQSAPTAPAVYAYMMCYNGTTHDRCRPGVTDTDDNSLAFSQVSSLLLGLNYKSDGSSWVRERVYLEDAAAAGHDGGQLVITGGIRQDVIAASTSTDGDYSNFKVDSFGAQWVNCRTGCSGGTQYNEDDAHASGNTGTLALVRRADAASSSSGTDGDNSTMNVDASGLLWTRNMDPCSALAKTHIAINVSSSGTTELTPSLAGASNNYYVCSIDIVTAAANNVALTDDANDNCPSVDSGLAGGTTAATGWNFAANGGLVKGNGMGTVYKTNGTNRVICLVTSAPTQLSGSIQVVAAP